MSEEEIKQHAAKLSAHFQAAGLSTYEAFLVMSHMTLSMAMCVEYPAPGTKKAIALFLEGFSELSAPSFS